MIKFDSTVIREDLRHGFFMITWRYPLNNKWTVELRDPCGNVIEILETIRQDCVVRNQERIREKSKRWFPETMDHEN